MDRRKLRTRQTLRDALMNLILEHGYDTITVQQITERANLGRATFYLHFKDKEELLFSSLQETVDELSKKMMPELGSGIIDGSQPASLIVFQHVDENRQLFRVMLNAQGDKAVISQLRMLIANVVEGQVKLFVSPELLPIPLAIIGQHAAGSLIALLSWWLETDSPYTPTQMAQMMNLLTVQPLVRAYMDSQSSTNQ